MTELYLPSHFTGAARLEKEAALLSYHGADEIVTGFAMQQRLAALPDHPRLSTGMPELDRLLDRVSGGEVYVVGGYPKHGKSLFLQTLTRNFARQEIHAVWFSYELTPKQFLARFPTLPYLVMPTHLTERAMAWLSDRIWEAKLKYDAKIVFIDHLHYLIDMVHLRQPSLEIGAIMRNLKRLSIEHNVTIFLVSHVNKRTNEQSMEQPPTDRDLRDSGLTAGEADTVLTIHRKRLSAASQEMSDEATVMVCLCRQSGVMYKSFTLKKQGGWLEEILS